MSSKSVTSKSSRSLQLDSSVQYLKGVGPKLGAVLESKGIATLRDLLFYFPRDYQDRSKVMKISEAIPMQNALIYGQVQGHRLIPVRKLRRPILEAIVTDGSSKRLSLKWFHYQKNYIEKLNEKPFLFAYGQVKSFGANIEMIHPDIEWQSVMDLADLDEGDAKSQGIVPIYSETEGLHQKTIRKLVQTALDSGLHFLTDELPDPIRKGFKFPELKEAVEFLHAPLSSTTLDELKQFSTVPQKRLIFEEFFKFEWIIGKRRLNSRREKTKAYSKNEKGRFHAMEIFEQLKKSLPFELTEEQLIAIEKIHEDLGDDKSMNRLLQGDVGCGKTLVAFCAALPVIAHGGQTALLCPTEILSEQHFLNAKKWLTPLSIRIDQLTGSTSKSKREELLAKLKNGEIDLLLGTHALLEDPVQFRELGLIIIDEQHRFGVDQRMKLKSKGKNPHVLSLTATPIPRTLALTAYGDLDVTVVRQLPKGRPPIYTKICREKERSDAHTLIKAEIAKGRQAYVIYPLVEESEKIDLANAVSGAEELANGPLQGCRIGLLHGKMKSQEKAEVMKNFKDGKIDVLVSTTVVEVGVDVPNATVLAIEHAERFGLSQLHQLRGRIGRGTEASHCILFTAGSSEEAFKRLRAMEETRDGFRLAELDLEIRGPGEFLGTRQSGELQFKYGSLIRDQVLLQEARKAAFELLQKDPELLDPLNLPLRLYMQRAGYLQEKRFETA